MSAYELDVEQQQLGEKLRFLLRHFEGRTLDDECLAEMAKTLNEELASELDGRSIQLLRDDPGIRVEVACAPSAGVNGQVGVAASPAGLVGLEAVKAALAA